MKWMPFMFINNRANGFYVNAITFSQICKRLEPHSPISPCKRLPSGSQSKCKLQSNGKTKSFLDDTEHIKLGTKQRYLKTTLLFWKDVLISHCFSILNIYKN